jgi:hypothetical protein
MQKITPHHLQWVIQSHLLYLLSLEIYLVFALVSIDHEPGSELVCQNNLFTQANSKNNS